MDNQPEKIPLRPGANMAPVKPLLAIRDGEKKPSSSLTDAIKERYTHYIKKDEEVFRDLFTMGHLTSLFIQGKQNLKWNPLAKTFYSTPVHQSSKNFITPIMRFYATNGEARYISSNPKIIVTAAKEDDRADQAAKAGQVVVNYAEQKLYTNRFNRNEALLLQSFGTQINRIRRTKNHFDILICPARVLSLIDIIIYHHR